MNKIRRTSPSLIVILIGAGVVVGRLVPAVVLRLDGNAPQVTWGAALALVLGAAAVGALAWTTWQSLHKKRRRMTSDHGIRMLALGQASAAVGAFFAGGYVGFALAFVDSMESPAGKDRVLHGGAAAVAGLLLMIAGLLLERACRIPGDGDEDGSGAKHAPGTSPA